MKYADMQQSDAFKPLSALRFDRVIDNAWAELSQCGRYAISKGLVRGIATYLAYRLKPQSLLLTPQALASSREAHQICDEDSLKEHAP